MLGFHGALGKGTGSKVYELGMAGCGDAGGLGIAGCKLSGAVGRCGTQFGGKVAFKGGLVSVEAEMADGARSSGEGPGAKDG